jgi:hypothetical protein
MRVLESFSRNLRPRLDATGLDDNCAVSAGIATYALTKHPLTHLCSSLINGCPQGSAAMAITLPLLAPTFTSRDMFKTGQGQQPPINFQQLQMFHSCDTVTIRWMTTNTAPIPSPKPVVGIIIASVVPAPSGNKYPYIIDNVYSEFDAAAWLQNLNDAGICKGSTGLPEVGGNATACTAAPSASGSGASMTSAGASPYSNGTSTHSSPTGSASNPPAYSGPAYTGAASSLKSSFAGLAAIAVGVVAYLN